MTKSRYAIQWGKNEDYPCVVLNKENDASVVKLEFRISGDVLYLKDGNKVSLYHEYFLHPRLIEYRERELREISGKHPEIYIKDLKDLKALELILIEDLKSKNFGKKFFKHSH